MQFEEYRELLSGKRHVPSTSEETAGQFQKKVFVIEAVQYTGSNLDEIKQFVGSPDGNTNTGRWVYPDGGGYKSNMKRIK